MTKANKQTIKVKSHAKMRSAVDDWDYDQGNRQQSKHVQSPLKKNNTQLEIVKYT